LCEYADVAATGRASSAPNPAAIDLAPEQLSSVWNQTRAFGQLEYISSPLVSVLTRTTLQRVLMLVYALASHLRSTRLIPEAMAVAMKQILSLPEPLQLLLVHRHPLLCCETTNVSLERWSHSYTRILRDAMVSHMNDR
jgi:hypothetical protein